MKPEKENLKDEIKHRLSLLEDSIKESENDEFLRLIYCNEHSQNTEFLNLIGTFENRIGFEQFENSKFTPIKCKTTGEPLKIGDYVENYQKQCGTLQFDDCFNKYVIKTETGGHINSTVYIKIQKLYEYTIDNTSVECRKNPYKQRW